MILYFLFYHYYFFTFEAFQSPYNTVLKMAKRKSGLIGVQEWDATGDGECSLCNLTLEVCGNCIGQTD